MFCPQCGASTQQHARFCRSCGAALEPVAVEEKAARADGVRPGYLPANIGVLKPAFRPTVYAGLWRRLAAAFIDGIALLAINFVLGLMLGVVLGLGAPATPESTLTILATLLSVIANIVYYPLQESSAAQATLGKRALGIKVTDLYGRRISFWRGVGRTFGKWLSALTLGIGYLMAAFTARKQALHDMVAGTLVVRTS